MFDKFLNENDLDFATLWSRMYFDGDFSSVKNEIQALARGGQINAIQEWYKNCSVGEDEVIDNLIIKLWKGCAENCFAYALYLDQNPSIKQKEVELKDKITRSLILQNMKKYEAELKSLDNYFYFDQAIRHAYDTCMPEKEYWGLVEMAELIEFFAKRKAPTVYLKQKLFEEAVRYNDIGQKNLVKLNAKNPRPIHKFYYAKSLLLSSRLDEGYKEEKQEKAEDILWEFASRSLIINPEEME